MFFIVLFCLLPNATKASTVIKESPETTLPTIIYSDEQGKEQTFGSKKNKLTALHFWATWCVPCVKELPQIDAIQKKYAGKGFKVIALSLDGKNTDKARKFYNENAINSLALFFDANLSAFQQLKIKGLPTTIFINSKGEEIARTEGDLDWESNEVEEFIDLQIK